MGPPPLRACESNHNMDHLDDFLNAGTEPLVEPIAEDTAPEPETIGQPRDETGRFAPKPETGVETATADPVPPTELPPETFKGLKEEREKRQNLERELEALKQQFNAQQNPPAPPPSVWEDEQAWGGTLVDEAVQRATFNSNLNMSEFVVRQANPDFEEMKAKFLDMAALNPSLQQQALADPHPWNKAYTIAKNAAKMEALGAVDVADLETRLREQIRAEMAAQPAPALPTSLADAQSARSGSVTPPAFSFEDIFKR